LHPGCTPNNDRPPPGCNTRQRRPRDPFCRSGRGFWRDPFPESRAGQTGSKTPDKPHFPTLSARRSVKFLASLKSGFSLPRFSVRSPFTRVWEGCMVGLNWIEVLVFLGFSPQEPSRLQVFGSFATKDPLKTRGYALSLDKVPERISGTFSTRRLPEDHPRSSSPSSRRSSAREGFSGFVAPPNLHQGFANAILTPTGDDRRFSFTRRPRCA
jgi:hypothetical protein